MITLNDCIQFLGLTPEEIDAIAEHERIVRINALFRTPIEYRQLI